MDPFRLIEEMLVDAGDKYYGYCFTEDGRYAPKVVLTGPYEVYNYLRLQSHLFPRVIATDILDNIVAEIVDGRFVFPPEWKKLNREEG